MIYQQFPASTVQMNSMYPPRILISHSSKDAAFCDLFAEFLVSLGFTNKTIIYTSRSEFGIPAGADIYDYLRNNLNRKLLVFFMLSANFYSSTACLNEMGAAWVKQNAYYSILLPGFTHKDIDGAINPRKMTLDLCDPVRLTELKDAFKSTWTLPLNNARWTSIQYDFIEKMKQLYNQ